MNRFFALMGFAAAIALVAPLAASAADAHPAGLAPSDSLFRTVSALDTAVFDAFNHCSLPGELQKHASYFAPDVEFYHDNGGVTWTRKEMLSRTRQNVCGHFRRELVADSLQVFPIKDFGAIEQGVHRFCQFDTGKCDGIANFVVVWRHQGEKWQITRVLSYGHEAVAQVPADLSHPPRDSAAAP